MPEYLQKETLQPSALSRSEQMLLPPTRVSLLKKMGRTTPSSASCTICHTRSFLRYFSLFYDALEWSLLCTAATVSYLEESQNAVQLAGAGAGAA